MPPRRTRHPSGPRARAWLLCRAGHNRPACCVCFRVVLSHGMRLHGLRTSTDARASHAFVALPPGLGRLGTTNGLKQRRNVVQATHRLASDLSSRNTLAERSNLPVAEKHPLSQQWQPSPRRMAPWMSGLSSHRALEPLQVRFLAKGVVLTMSTNACGPLPGLFGGIWASLCIRCGAPIRCFFA